MFLEEHPVELHDYDPAWLAQFTTLAIRAQSAIGSAVVRIEHVGSAAVVGLAAKPVIDLDIVVRTQSDVLDAIRRLSALGYAHEGDLGIAGRKAFRCPPGEQRHHLYLLVEGADELARHLAFRDALRADTALREKYGDLKRSLADKYRNDRAAYTNGKTAFIAAVLARNARDSNPEGIAS
jgi:GrpB-like predicted nucleotidyltransferase (UPF0157 family)